MQAALLAAQGVSRPARPVRSRARAEVGVPAQRLRVTFWALRLRRKRSSCAPRSKPILVLPADRALSRQRSRSMIRSGGDVERLGTIRAVFADVPIVRRQHRRSWQNRATFARGRRPQPAVPPRCVADRRRIRPGAIRRRAVERSESPRLDGAPRAIDGCATWRAAPAKPIHAHCTRPTAMADNYDVEVLTPPGFVARRARQPKPCSRSLTASRRLIFPRRRKVGSSIASWRLIRPNPATA